MKINCSWAPLLVLRGFSEQRRRREPGTQQAWLESWAHSRAGVSSRAQRWVWQCAFFQSIGTFNTGLWLFKIHKCCFSLWRNSRETGGRPGARSRVGTHVSEMLLAPKWRRGAPERPLTTRAQLTQWVTAASRPWEPEESTWAWSLGQHRLSRNTISLSPSVVTTRREISKVSQPISSLCPCLLLKDNTNRPLFLS